MRQPNYQKEMAKLRCRIAKLEKSSAATGWLFRILALIDKNFSFHLKQAGRLEGELISLKSRAHIHPEGTASVRSPWPWYSCGFEPDGEGGLEFVERLDGERKP